MTAACRTVDDAYAAGLTDSHTDPPLSQEQADYVAALLAARQPERRAA
jgi:hypothetical protein